MSSLSISSVKNTKYTLKKTLGSGTWGTVFEAIDTSSIHQEIVAVKKMIGKDAANSGVDFTALREGI